MELQMNDPEERRRGRQNRWTEGDDRTGGQREMIEQVDGGR